MRKTILLLAVSGCAAIPAHASSSATYVAPALMAMGALGGKAELTFPDRGRSAVVDAAHVLPPAVRDALNRRVVAWDRATGHQLAILTVPDLQGLDVKTYGYRLGRAWGLGDARRNDGAVLLLSMKPHKARIEVGYGLEPVLTDAVTSAILADRVVPRLKTGDAPGALNAGADAIMTVASTEEAAPAPASTGRSDWGWLVAAIGATVAAGIGWIALTVRRGKRRFERMAAVAAARQKRLQAEIDRPVPPKPHFTLDTPVAAAASHHDRSGTAGTRALVAPTSASPAAAPAPVFIPPTYDPPSPSRYSSDDSSSSSSSSWGSFDSGSSSSSSDSSSSSSGFDSSGGSFGGGGSDSSW